MIILYKIGILELMIPLEQTFTQFFSKLEHQLYLEVVKVKKSRIAMSKLRVSSHRLEIEVGRWSRLNRTPLDERNVLDVKNLKMNSISYLNVTYTQI